MKKTTTYGAEIEKAVSSKITNQSHHVASQFFEALVTAATKRGAKTKKHHADLNPQAVIGILSDDIGEQGLDNGYNLLETSTVVCSSLQELQKILQLDLASTMQALRQEDASIINSSNHPLAVANMSLYKEMVAPKSIYSYIWFRGWNHAAGIDARAQNSPSTGVDVSQAAEAVTAIIGVGAAVVALTANSPFEQGARSKYKESRLKIWENMFRYSKVSGDRTVSNFPEKPFKNIAEYFQWMFGGDTALHFIIDAKKNGYKNLGDSILLPPQPMSILDYLSRKKVEVLHMKDLINAFPPSTQYIIPSISHMEAMQWTQFAGARIRFKLKDHDNFPIEEFVEGCKNGAEVVEEIFEKFCEYTYIEGRDPGANFPDAKTREAEEVIADSVVIAPSALQAGIINNLENVSKYLSKFEWSTLGKLREEAIVNGLHGAVGNHSVYEFTKEILAFAHDGLSKEDREYLAYFDWVLTTKKNGADRAIEFVSRSKHGTSKAIIELTKHLEVK